MSGVWGRDGKHIARTVTYLLKCPASSVPQAMLACKYSDKECSNVATQMAVRQAWKVASKVMKKSPPPHNQRVDNWDTGVDCVLNYHCCHRTFLLMVLSNN
jgi:hypothetical protein